jgi:hypothetical protein
MASVVLLFSLLVCALPLLIGLLIGRSAAQPQAITVLASIAVGLTLLGLLLYVAGIGKPGYAGLDAILLGFLLTILGLFCACFGCGLALATAQRLGQRSWFVALLFTALLPLVAALAIFDSAILLPGQPTTPQVITLSFLFAPFGAMAVVVYGISGQRAALPNT